MRTRSNFYPFNSTATIPIRSNRRRVPNIVEPKIRTIEEIIPMADRTMEELLQAPPEGYEEAIVILEILEENFEIKTNLLQDVSNDAIKLMLFRYSLEGAVRIWYEKKPPNSILTWDDLVNKFVNQFFPPSKTTHLKNKISRFTQRFDETFGEAWDRFKEMLRACLHHGFSELTQIDTFYNDLTKQDQDSLNATSGDNLLNKTTREALKIIENKLKVRYSKSKSNVSRVNTNSRDNVSKTDDKIEKLANQISNLVEIVNKLVITPAPSKAVEKTCVTYGGAHAYYDCIATDGSFFQNQPSTSSTLPSNTVPNPKGEMKAVTTRSGLAYEGLLILTSYPLEKVVEQNTKEIMDKEHSNCPGRMEVCHALADLGASINLMPLSIWKKLSLPELTPTRMTLDLADRSITRPKGVAEDVFVKVGKFHILTDFVVVDFEADPRVPLILWRSFLRTGRALIDVYREEITLRVNDKSVTFSLNQTMRYSLTYDDNYVNQRDVVDIACEEFFQHILDFLYNPKSSNPTLVSDSLNSESRFSKEPIVKFSSPTLTPFGESNFLEEIEDFLNDDLIPVGIENYVYDPEGDILFHEKLLN
nr:reverse transcriptase domain-containing protein [Tanacetum cinerariifolium]